MAAPRNRAFLLAVALLGVSLIAGGDEVLYGGNGGHSNASSINDGSLVILDQVSAALTVVGHPTGISRLTGIAFDSSGALYGSTQEAGGFPPPPPSMSSTLIRIDPDTGALLSTIGPIVEGTGGPAISISDISFQPGTGVLFGVRSPVDGAGGEGLLYRIDKATGVATSVANTNTHFGTIAFAPNGTLYESAAVLGTQGPAEPTIRTINPSNGAVLTSAPTTFHLGALAVREDGTIFGSTGDRHAIVTIDPVTGAFTDVGDTDKNFVGAMAFRRPVAPSGPCVPDDHTLCLNGGRFEVTARWRTTNGNSGQGTGVKLTADSGYFWFFNPANIEIVIKVLNACSVNNAYWVFAAGLTNAEVTLSVTDTQTGAVRTYNNPLSNPFAPVQDTSAFGTCP